MLRRSLFGARSDSQRMLALVPLVLLVGCKQQSAHTGSTSQRLGTFYDIDFSTQPNYLPNNAIALTFDDAPDYNNTARVLDTLKANGIQTTFFLNTENWSSVNNDPPMQALIRRMVAEGHTLANHTVHHAHLGTLDANGIEAEIAGVEQTVQKPEVLGSSAPRLTLFRAPYGEPFQDNSDPMGTVASVVATHAVEIGWAVDSNDWQCAGSPDCVYNNVTGLIRTPGNGSYGVMLLHAVQPQTADALQRIIDYLRSNGFVLWSVEDVVRARYGKSSGELLGGGGCTPQCGGNQCGDDGCGGSCGSCASGQTCSNGQCSGGGCTPQCGGNQCGDDGCGGSCGSCAAGETCSNGVCTASGCSAPAYQPGQSYAVGDQVQNGGQLFECNDASLCGAGGDYEPGVGASWTDAWTLLQDCTTAAAKAGAKAKSRAGILRANGRSSSR